MKLFSVLSATFIGYLFLMILLPTQANVGAVVSASGTSTGPAPDLVIESFTLEPATPQINEPVVVSIRVRNQGDANASGGFRTYLYIDPLDQPPITDTEDTQQWGYFITLPPDGVVEFEWSGHTFDEGADKHVLYAWVDRDNRIAEGDETNNLQELSFRIEPTAVQLDTLNALNAQKTPRFAILALLALVLGVVILSRISPPIEIGG